MPWQDERVLVVVVAADGGNVSKEERERKCECGWIGHLHECNERRGRRE